MEKGLSSKWEEGTLDTCSPPHASPFGAPQSRFGVDLQGLRARSWEVNLVAQIFAEWDVTGGIWSQTTVGSLCFKGSPKGYGRFLQDHTLASL